MGNPTLCLPPSSLFALGGKLPLVLMSFPAEAGGGAGQGFHQDHAGGVERVLFPTMCCTSDFCLFSYENITHKA